jgi:hypothetical protein
MSKFSVFCAAALMAVAGVASANTIPLLDGSTTYTFTKASNSPTAVSIALPTKQSEANGLIVDFTFSYTGTLVRNDFLGFWFGNADAANFGLKTNRDGTSSTDDLFARNSANATVSYIGGSDLGKMPG